MGPWPRGEKWTAVYTPCPRALSVLSSHKWGSLLPYTIWLMASVSPTYAYLLPALCGWQVPLQPAHHCFCNLAADEDDLAEGSFTCTAVRMEGQEAPDWGSPSQASCSSAVPRPPSGPKCLPALLDYGSHPRLPTSKRLAEQETEGNGTHMHRDCIATSRTTGQDALENFMRDQCEGKAL